MSIELRPGPSRRQGTRQRLSRHAWIVILLIVTAAILALCGRSASAQRDRGEEIIERALALKPDSIEGGRLYRKHCIGCHGPPLTEPQLGDGKQLVLGGRIYKAICADCHGARGEGDDRRQIPALRGQHYSYLLRQARQLTTGHRYSVDLSVIMLLEALSLDQLTAVVDFISRLPASGETESLAADGQARLGLRRIESAALDQRRLSPRRGADQYRARVPSDIPAARSRHCPYLWQVITAFRPAMPGESAIHQAASC